jgi:N-acyl-D-aspartate/D-glutamate deacylase
VDVHSHYDGQAIWSSQLSPSSNHGVTTVVMGNCGVGFAPCRRADQALLINAMEGVEDIPEAVMVEGLNWEWESFPEFLEAVERRPHDIDLAGYLPHSALRIYVMGERGAEGEPATDEDLEGMVRVTTQAVAAGALGVATSRVLGHRRADGALLPSTFAEEKELVALACAVKAGGGGLFQVVPDLQQAEEEDAREVVELMARVSEAARLAVTFSFPQSNRFPTRWRKILDWIDEANSRPNVALRPQIYPRPIGMILGHELSNNPFLMCPSYQQLLNLSLGERVEALSEPGMRARLIEEAPVQGLNPMVVYGRMFERMFELGDPPNYEPNPEDSIVQRAARAGVTPEALAYDLLLENEGRNTLYCAFVNYGDGTLDFVLEMLSHPTTKLGLGDGGAHYGMLCDASYPTFVLTHWTRDRAGERLSLERAVRALTAETAELAGFDDRGLVAKGYKADLNVIDYQNLRLLQPEIRFDLPGGGRRLHQRADGYRWTIVSGQPIARDGVATGLLPGRLLRGPQRIEAAGAA